MDDGSFNRVEKTNAAGHLELDEFVNIVIQCSAMQEISNIIREFFNGSYPTWGFIPKMRCNWKEADADIAKAWNCCSSQSYSEAVYRSKILYKGAEKKFSWMEYDELVKLLIHWEKEETKKKMKQARKNCGVPLDKDGNKIEGAKAPCTSTNGPKPVGKDIKSFKAGHTIKIKQKPIKRKTNANDSIQDVLCSDTAAKEGKEVQPTAKKVWINSLSKEIYVSYFLILLFSFT